MVLVEIALEIAIAHFVEVLEFAEVLCLGLDGIVGEVYVFVAEVLEIELTTACPDVPVLVEVALNLLVDAREQRKYSEIKFSPVDQQRLVNILLDYERAFLLVHAWLQWCVE